ncbi:hypothetical protein BU16DRAFT_459324, partial [Lophium mytilinum]
GHLQTPSNVTRICRAILPEDRNHHPQIVYYQSGVGNGSTYLERLVGGGTGEGIGEHIREAYGFLANNYTPGDSIFLIGFSRGAFTARSIGGLIGGMGLLEKAGMPWFYLIFKDWENAGVKGYKPSILHSIPDFHIAAPPEDIKGYLSSYKSELLKRGLTRDVEIQAIGVWDTVGALGIPTTPLLQKVGLPDFLHEYRFLDTSLDNHVRNAFHAMALDEQRASYAPTIWEKPPYCTTNIKQVWFPGVHSNVGGSYDDTGIADITLAWMMSNLRHWIDFNPNYIREQHLLNQKYNSSQKPPLTRGWSLGKIYDSCTFPTSLGGREPRKPGTYTRTNYMTGQETSDPLEATHEKMHISVRARLLMEGKGYEDVGSYAPHSLSTWDMRNVDQYSGHATANGFDGKGAQWIYQGENPAFQGKVIFEDRLEEFELELLRMDPIAAAEIL